MTIPLRWCHHFENPNANPQSYMWTGCTTRFKYWKRSALPVSTQTAETDCSQTHLSEICRHLLYSVIGYIAVTPEEGGPCLQWTNLRAEMYSRLAENSMWLLQSKIWRMLINILLLLSFYGPWTHKVTIVLCIFAHSCCYLNNKVDFLLLTCESNHLTTCVHLSCSTTLMAPLSENKTHKSASKLASTISFRLCSQSTATPQPSGFLSSFLSKKPQDITLCVFVNRS